MKQSKRNANRPHYQGTWQADRNRIKQAWIATHGHWCPGDTAHPPHPCRDLTVDHDTPRSGTTGYTVMCRSANSSKGARQRKT